jgi:adenylate cyclase
LGIEIERKFLVINDDWQPLVTEKKSLQQGYLTREDGPAVVRVRVEEGAKARINVKSSGTGLVRSEFEYEIPVADANELLLLCGDYRLKKIRHIVPVGDLTWEIDVFAGRHSGLVIAEVELSDADRLIELPSWTGQEVTGDRTYSNQELARPA